MKKIISVSAFVFLLLQSSALMAAKFYKCTNADGHIVYQNKSRSGKQTDGKVEILDNGSSRGDFGKQSIPSYSTESRRTIPANNNYGSSDTYKSNDDLQDRLDEIDRKYEKKKKKDAKERCQRYKKRYKASEKKGKYMKRNGYSLSDKKRYKQNAAMDKIDMEKHCGR